MLAQHSSKCYGFLSPFSLMSCRLIGFREYSQDSAYRTRPLESCSRLPLPPPCSWSSMLTSSSSSGVASRLRRWVCVGGGVSSSTGCSVVSESTQLILSQNVQLVVFPSVAALCV